MKFNLKGRWKHLQLLRKIALIKTMIGLIFVLSLSSFTLLQHEVVITKKQSTCRQIFREVESQTGIVTIFNDDVVAVDKMINLTTGKIELRKLYEELSNHADFDFSVEGDYIVVKVRKNEILQQGIDNKILVKGKITDTEGLPLPGVTIVIKGTTQGTITDMEGNYEFKVAKDATLVFRSIGFKTVEKQVNNQSKLSLSMELEITGIGEVVVNGYQTIAKERATGSFTIVDKEQLEDQLALSILDKINQTTPGVLATKEGLQIRGLSSLLVNSDPLVVIDGFPVESRSGSVNEITSLINPEDIESVTFLKDAASASIYGVKASNGVIVIETKRKNEGQFNISYSGQVFWQNYNDHRDIDNASNASVVANEFNQYKTGIYPVYDQTNNPKGYRNKPVQDIYKRMRDGQITEQEAQQELSQLASLDYTDQYYDLLARPSVNYQNSLSLSGSSDQLDYHLSLRSVNGHGSRVDNSNSTYMINSRNRFHFNDKISIDFGLMKRWQKNESNPVPGMQERYQPLRHANGDYAATPHQYNDETLATREKQGLDANYYYPALDYKEIENTESDEDLRIQTALNFTINKNLRFTTKFQSESGITENDHYASENSHNMKRFYNDYTTVDESVNPNTGETVYKLSHYLPRGGMLKRTYSKYKNINWQNILHFNFNFNSDDHLLSGMIGHEIKDLQNETFDTGEIFGYNPDLLTTAPVPDHRVNYWGQEETKTWRKNNRFWETQNRYVSVYSNFTHSLQNKYSFNFNIRLDQTNLFGTDPKYRYRPLWSLGGAWNVDKEDFFTIDWVNYLKLKGSYGVTGNVGKQYSPYLQIKIQTDVTGNVQSWIHNPPNDKLRWEKTDHYNIGLESYMFNNRLGLLFEYYLKKGTDLLGRIPLDPTYGFSYATVNSSSMKNQGFELSLNGVIYQNEKWKVDGILNFSQNNNEVTKYALKESFATQLVKGFTQLEGQPADMIYAWKWAGLDDTGYPCFFDEEGNKLQGKTENFTSNSPELLKKIGRFNAPIYGSFTPAVQYKNLKLTAAFAYKFGHFYKRGHYSKYDINGYVHPDLDKAWKQPGDEKKTDVPGLLTGGNDERYEMYKNSSHLYEKADNITLEYISLSYKLKTISVLKNALIQIQASNLGTIWVANSFGENPNLYNHKTLYNNTVMYLNSKPQFTASIKLNF